MKKKWSVWLKLSHKIKQSNDNYRKDWSIWSLRHCRIFYKSQGRIHEDEHNRMRNTLDYLVIFEEPPKKSMRSHNINMRGSQIFPDGESHLTGTRSKSNQILVHPTPYGKTILQYILMRLWLTLMYWNAWSQ